MAQQYSFQEREGALERLRRRKLGEDEPERGTHIITATEIVRLSKSEFGVRSEFDDGDEQTIRSGHRERAEWDAYDRIVEELPVGANAALRSGQRMEELKAYRSKVGDRNARPARELLEGLAPASQVPPPGLRKMSEFDPTKPAIVHDATNDQLFAWHPRSVEE